MQLEGTTFPLIEIDLGLRLEGSKIHLGGRVLGNTRAALRTSSGRFFLAGVVFKKSVGKQQVQGLTEGRPDSPRLSVEGG